MCALLMRRKHKSLLLILFSVLLVDSGQLILKKGLLDLGGVDLSVGLFPFFVTMFSSPLVLLGIALFASSSVTWLLALSKSQLSFAYPILSIGYVVVSILSWYFFGENLSSLRLIGLGFIVGGVYVMSRS